MSNQLVKRARDQRVFSREDTPTEQRVEAAFLYQLSLLYRQVGEWLGYSHQAVHEWFTALDDLFEPKPDDHKTFVVVDDREVYVWAAIDRHTYKAINVDTSPGQSALDALLFLWTVLKRCRGRPVAIADRGWLVQVEPR